MANHRPEESLTRIVFWPIWLAGRYALGLVFLSAFALLIAVMAYRWQWQVTLDGEEAQPITPATMQILTEHALAYSATAHWSATLGEAAYTVYFRWSGVHAIAMNQRAETALSRFIQRFPNETAMAMLAARLYGIRVGSIAMMLPVVLLVVVLAITDGWAERAIRRACAGHESATRFRIAKALAFKLLPPAIGLFYLCLPLDLSPGGAILPALAVTGLLIRTKVAYFKKHL